MSLQVGARARVSSARFKTCLKARLKTAVVFAPPQVYEDHGEIDAGEEEHAGEQSDFVEHCVF